MSVKETPDRKKNNNNKTCFVNSKQIFITHRTLHFRTKLLSALHSPEPGSGADSPVAKNPNVKPWTKEKRDTSCKYQEDLNTRLVTFTKKTKTLRTVTGKLASQTRAQIKIEIYNADTKLKCLE